MFSLRIVLCASLAMLLCSNSDEDLQADIETAECLRQLRLDKYRWQAWYKAVK